MIIGPPFFCPTILCLIPLPPTLGDRRRCSLEDAGITNKIFFFDLHQYFAQLTLHSATVLVRGPHTNMYILFHWGFYFVNMNHLLNPPSPQNNCTYGA